MILVSVRSELVFQVYKLLALLAANESGFPPSDEEVIEILSRANELVTNINALDVQSLYDNTLMLDPGGNLSAPSAQRTAKTQEVYSEVGALNEQVRFLSETVVGFDGQSTNVLKELARQIVTGEKSRNFGDVVQASFELENVTPVSFDANLDEIGIIWTEYQNTNASHGSSESSIFFGENGVNQFTIQFQSNVESGLESLQHGIYQVHIPAFMLDRYRCSPCSGICN